MASPFIRAGASPSIAARWTAARGGCRSTSWWPARSSRTRATIRGKRERSARPRTWCSSSPPGAPWARNVRTPSPACCASCAGWRCRHGSGRVSSSVSRPGALALSEEETPPAELPRITVLGSGYAPEHGLEQLRGRHVLLLQGPAGPFFRRVSGHLRRRGCRITKVNFNSGDDLYYRGAEVVRFRGARDQWPAFLARLFDERGIEAIVLFGDCRPLHRVAIEHGRASGRLVF